MTHSCLIYLEYIILILCTNGVHGIQYIAFYYLLMVHCVHWRRNAVILRCYLKVNSFVLISYIYKSRSVESLFFSSIVFFRTLKLFPDSKLNFNGMVKLLSHDVVNKRLRKEIGGDTYTFFSKCRIEYGIYTI